MSWPLQKSPFGLLEALRLRTQGNQPDEFSNTVGGSYDVRDAYGADLLLTQFAASAAGALSGRNVTNVHGAPLRLRGISAHLTVGAAAVTAGGYLECGIIQRTLSSASGVLVPFAFGAFGVAAAGATLAVGVPCDILLPAGITLYAKANGTAAGADHVVNVQYLFEDYSRQL